MPHRATKKQAADWWARKQPCRFVIDAIIAVVDVPTVDDATTPHGEVVDNSAAAIAVHAADAADDHMVIIMTAGNPAFLTTIGDDISKMTWELPMVCSPRHMDYTPGGILRKLLPGGDHDGVVMAYRRPALVTATIASSVFIDAELAYSLYGGLAEHMSAYFMQNVTTIVAEYGPAILLSHHSVGRAWPRLEPMCLGESARQFLNVTCISDFRALCLARDLTDGDISADAMAERDIVDGIGCAAEGCREEYEDACATARLAIAMLVRSNHLVRRNGGMLQWVCES